MVRTKWEHNSCCVQVAKPNINVSLLNFCQERKISPAKYYTLNLYTQRVFTLLFRRTFNSPIKIVLSAQVIT